jgi:hypothetical protein
VRGCVFTLMLGAIVIAFLVVVGLPALAGGVLTAGVSAAGLVADDTVVTVTSSPPTDLLGLHADTVRVTATSATFRGMRIGNLDLALGDVRILDRRAATIDGELRNVTVQGPGGRDLVIDRIVLLGGGDEITTTTLIAGEDAIALVVNAVEAELGVRPSSVRMVAPDRLVVEAGVTIGGRLAVTRSGNLVIRAEAGAAVSAPIVLLRGGEDVPILLTSVRVTERGGLELTGDLVMDPLG